MAKHTYSTRDFWRLALGMFFLLSTTAYSEAPAAHFVGSKSCEKCHAEAYKGWKQTRMANVVRDPKAHPEAALGDFTHPNPIVTLVSIRWRLYTEAAGSSATLPNAGTITTLYRRSGMCKRASGFHTTWRREPTGGCRFTAPRILTGQPDQPATDVTRSTTTSKRSK